MVPLVHAPSLPRGPCAAGTAVTGAGTAVVGRPRKRVEQRRNRRNRRETEGCDPGCFPGSWHFGR